MEYKGYHPDPEDILWQCLWGAVILGIPFGWKGAVGSVITVLFVNWFFHFRRLDT